MIQIPDEVFDLAHAGDLVVTGQLSGGKDGFAATHAGFAALEAAGVTFERALMHADVGLIDWRETPAMLERQSALLRATLHVTPVKGRGLIDRFMNRGERGQARWTALETYRLVGPFPTASQRFCSSEAKISKLNRLTGQLFKGRPVVQIIGVRRDESVRRRSTPDLSRVPDKSCAHGVRIWTWYPIADWSAERVFAYHSSNGLPLHQAYTQLCSTRVSCSTCVLASAADSRAAARHAPNEPAFRATFEIEQRFGFSYAHGRYAGDILAEFCSATWTKADADALERTRWQAECRRQIERQMPVRHKFEGGWPLYMPTEGEADAIAEARTDLGRVLGIEASYLTGEAVLARFDALLTARGTILSSV